MIIGYIKEENIANKLCKRIQIRYFDNNYIIVLDSKNKLKIKRKLIKKIKKLKIDAIVFSKSLEGEFEKQIRELLDFSNENNANVKIINGKKLMEYMQYEILEYIIKKKQEDIKLEDVYIVFKKDNELNLNFLKRFIENFRMTNIVTNELERLKNVQENLLENENILISVSNNKKKALKRAKYIINVNLDKSELEKYRINRDAIIINIKKYVKYDNLCFNGVNVNNFNVQLPDEYVEKFEVLNNEFDFTRLYESILISEYAENTDIEKIYKRIRDDKVRIKGVIGNNGYIPEKELEMSSVKYKSMKINNINLDKKQKIV